MDNLQGFKGNRPLKRWSTSRTPKPLRSRKVIVTLPADAEPDNQGTTPKTSRAEGTPTVHELWAAAATGDSMAFLSLYERTVPKIRGVARKYLRLGDEIQEAVDDVYLYAWAHPTRYDPTRGHVVDWLQGVARHKSIDLYRRRQLETRRDLMTGPIEGTEPNAERFILWTSAHRELHEALKSLPASRRRVLGLNFFRGLSHQDIADKLSQPLGTVKANIRRGLIALKRNLSDDLLAEAS